MSVDRVLWTCAAIVVALMTLFVVIVMISFLLAMGEHFGWWEFGLVADPNDPSPWGCQP